MELLTPIRSVLGDEIVDAAVGDTMGELEILRRAIEAGLPAEGVRALQGVLEHLRVPRPSSFVEEIATRASRHRRDRLTREEGERLMRVLGTILRALDSWGDEASAALFLTTPHAMLDGDPPIDRARSEAGAKQVESILYAMQVGLPA